MKRTLPVDWRWVKIGEITEVSTGGTPDTNHPEYYDNGDIRWLKSGDIKGTYIEEVPNRISQLGLNSSNAKTHPAGSVMLAMSGQGKTRGTSAILKIPSACSQSVAAILPSEHAIPEIIHFALVNRYGETRRITGDNERTGLNLKLIREIEIPLPPLDEQKRIIARLDEQMRHIEHARQAAEESLSAAWELPDSYSRQFLSSESSKWKTKKIKELCEIKGGKRLPAGTKFSDNPTAHPYIRVLDLGMGTVRTTDLKYITDKTFLEIKRYIIEKDDVYISIAGTIGSVGVIPIELDGANLTENAARLVVRDKQELDKDYLARYLQSAIGQEQIRKRTNTVGQPKLALTRIATIEIPVPPIEEQKSLSLFLNQKFSEFDKLQQTLESQLAEINELPSALLRQAFAGEL